MIRARGRDSVDINRVIVCRHVARAIRCTMCCCQPFSRQAKTKKYTPKHSARNTRRPRLRLLFCVQPTKPTTCHNNDRGNTSTHHMQPLVRQYKHAPYANISAAIQARTICKHCVASGGACAMSPGTDDVNDSLAIDVLTAK